MFDEKLDALRSRVPGNEHRIGKSSLEFNILRGLKELRSERSAI